MGPLGLLIRERIEREGPITFRSFMQEALYHPGLGYYTSGSTEIGKHGDFFTSPHLHSAFGAMLGRQMEEFWELMGRPERFDILEYGAGRGYLAGDMLAYLKGREMFESVIYTIVELNPHMAQRQGELLKEFGEKVRWAGSGEVEGPDEIRGSVVSNELLDAFPVHMVEMRGELMEVYVALDGDGFKEELGPPSTPHIGEYVDEFSLNLHEGMRTEVNLEIRPWIEDISSVLSEGFVLTVDYGYPALEYYSEERNRGTLLCYRGHQVSEDPLEAPGEQDITAHVNFSSLKKWGEDAGLKCLGYTRQGPYLVSLGIEEVIAGLFSKSTEYLREVGKIKGLIMPGGMGETHKVMVQCKLSGGCPGGLKGFQVSNQIPNL